MYNVENLCSKLNNLSFMSYIDKFDVACLTETFADSTFDFSRLFAGYVKFAAQAKNFLRRAETREAFCF